MIFLIWAKTLISKKSEVSLIIIIIKNVPSQVGADSSSPNHPLEHGAEAWKRIGGADARLTANTLCWGVRGRGPLVGTLDMHPFPLCEWAHSPWSWAPLLPQQRGSRRREGSVEGPDSRLGSGYYARQPVSSPAHLGYLNKFSGVVALEELPLAFLLKLVYPT